ncbi:MAG TPA: helix-turn-helix domain-containing protein [Xanthobacteraceae bacterium]|nr:helix-turn-helix domain-containing protein [Xanthobacteraceae bacterium]
MHTHTAVRADQVRRFVPATRNPPPSVSHTLDTAGEREPLAHSMHLMGAVMSYPRNAEIFGENEPAEYLYKVIAGSVRTYKILSDGRRQIGGFYLPGDIFGFQFAEEHTFSAEAITDVKVLVIKRSTLTALAGSNAAVARELFALTSRELRRMQDRVLLLIKSAQERVASFLLEMADRAAGGNVVELPMSRQDIADYLGLTIETVSRTLTCLESSAAIEVTSSRRIVLRNQTALSRLNG